MFGAMASRLATSHDHLSPDPHPLDPGGADLVGGVEEVAVEEDEVGDRATDVEMHLKGTRSTTNTDRVEEAGGAS